MWNIKNKTQFFLYLMNTGILHLYKERQLNHINNSNSNSNIWTTTSTWKKRKENCWKYGKNKKLNKLLLKVSAPVFTLKCFSSAASVNPKLFLCCTTRNTGTSGASRWLSREAQFINVYRLLLGHWETSISAVAALLDACDPVFNTKRSRLPNTSATKGNNHNNMWVKCDLPTL